MVLRIKEEEIITLEDGYKYYWPTDYPFGAFSAFKLREIADQLDELNRDWDKQIEEEFSKNAD